MHRLLINKVNNLSKSKQERINLLKPVEIPQKKLKTSRTPIFADKDH